MSEETAPEIVELNPVRTAVVRATVPADALVGFYDSAFSTVGAALATHGLTATTPAFGLYHGVPGDEVDLEVGFGVDGPVPEGGEVVASELPGGRVARTVHVGSFDGLGSSWQGLRTWIEAQGAKPGALMWEVYRTEPDPQMDPADLRTELAWTLDDEN